MKSITDIGAAASNWLTGIVVDHAGFNAGFWFLSAIAALALATFAFTVPEVSKVNPSNCR